MARRRARMASCSAAAPSSCAASMSGAAADAPRGLGQRAGQSRGGVERGDVALRGVARRVEDTFARGERAGVLGAAARDVGLEADGVELEAVVVIAADAAVIEARFLELVRLLRRGEAVFEGAQSRLEINDAGQRIARVGELVRDGELVALLGPFEAEIRGFHARPALAELDGLADAKVEVGRVPEPESIGVLRIAGARSRVGATEGEPADRDVGCGVGEQEATGTHVGAGLGDARVGREDLAVAAANPLDEGAVVPEEGSHRSRLWRSRACSAIHLGPRRRARQEQGGRQHDEACDSPHEATEVGGGQWLTASSRSSRATPVEARAALQHAACQPWRTEEPRFFLRIRRRIKESLTPPGRGEDSYRAGASGWLSAAPSTALRISASSASSSMSSDANVRTRVPAVVAMASNSAALGA